jgi:hypothetical protein
MKVRCESCSELLMIHVGWTQIVPDLTWFQQEAQPKVHGHHLRPRSAYGKFIGIL